MARLSPDQLVGKSTAELIPQTPAARAQYDALVQKFLAEIATESELEGVRADGARVWATSSVRPIRDANGQVIATQSAFVDITARKRAEEALWVSEERLARVLNSAMDAIVTFDIITRSGPTSG